MLIDVDPTSAAYRDRLLLPDTRLRRFKVTCLYDDQETIVELDVDAVAPFHARLVAAAALDTRCETGGTVLRVEPDR